MERDLAFEYENATSDKSLDEILLSLTLGIDGDEYKSGTTLHQRSFRYKFLINTKRKGKMFPIGWRYYVG